MLRLQEEGQCHNINLVTPEHVAPQVAEALAVAVEKGLALPVVYNTSGYDSLASLALMDGLVVRLFVLCVCVLCARCGCGWRRRRRSAR